MVTGCSSGAAVPAPGRAVDRASATSSQLSPLRCWMLARRTSCSFGACALVPVARRERGELAFEVFDLPVHFADLDLRLEDALLRLGETLDDEAEQLRPIGL